jgi:hypothetical protein
MLSSHPEVHDVWFCATETPGSRHHGNIIFLRQQEEIARLHRCKKPFDPEEEGTVARSPQNLLHWKRGQDSRWFRRDPNADA